jgi:hypothetical protein
MIILKIILAVLFALGALFFGLGIAADRSAESADERIGSAFLYGIGGLLWVADLVILAVWGVVLLLAS